MPKCATPHLPQQMEVAPVVVRQLICKFQEKTIMLTHLYSWSWSS